MTGRCDVELIYDEIYLYVKKILYKEDLTSKEKEHFFELANQYWDITCPEGNPCKANTCSFSKPTELLETYNFKNLNDFFWFNGKQPKTIDCFMAKWARLPGHFENNN